MLANSLFVAAVLTGVAIAKTCVNITVPVDISARTGVFDIKIPETNLDSTIFIQNFTRQGRNYTETALLGYATTAGCYNISAQFCAPSTPKSSTLQILTHGIGFDKT